MMYEYAIGVLTCNREESFNSCISSIEKYRPDNSIVFVADNTIGERYTKQDDWYILLDTKINNIAHSKNILIESMLKTNAYHLFIVEDDMSCLSTEAFTGYSEAFQQTGVHHFIYAHHGDRNKLVDSNDVISTYYECVGSWCYYTRDSIRRVGLMDENFDNCWEHVVHSLLIADSGLMGEYGWRNWPDIKDSFNYITETGSVSLNGKISDEELMRQDRIQNGLNYWKSNYRFPKDIEELVKK